MRIHFIGIGGIGVSALARYYLSRKDKVFGSDLAESEITKGLIKIGARIFIGRHKAKNIAKNADLVIYSPAVTDNNAELKEARAKKIKVESYPEALGELTKKYFTIAVSGTHGKGTTTAMISLILIKAGLDPTVIIGTKLKEFGDSNFRQGKSKYLVIEADEYKSSFLNYWPKIIVLTTIDKDHLDYFKTLGNIIKTFRKFVGHLPKHGWLVANRNDKNIEKLVSPTYTHFPTIVKKWVWISKEGNEAKKLKKVLKIPGDHILADALTALAVARILKIPDKTSFKALSEYRGAWRRFQELKLKIKNLKFKIISDYAHHPTEILVTLKAARQKYPDRKICCVFQPHQYQRTFYLFKDFVKVFVESEINKLILIDIYSVSGRESAKIKSKVSSEKLAREIKKSAKNKEIIHLPNNKKAADYLKTNLKKDEVLIIMGAGNVYELAQLLTAAEKKAKIK